MEYNYGTCNRPDCDYCKEIKAANVGVTPLAPAASVDALKLTEDQLGVRIDAAVSGLVHGAAAIAIADDAPATAADGSVFIVSATPKAGGAFVGHANEVASKAAGAWKFQSARAQETHLVEADNTMWTWSTTTTPPAWVKVGSVSGEGKLNETIHKATAKTAPVDDDEFAITDSADAAPATFTLKKLTFANLKTGIWNWMKGVPANSPIADTDTFITKGGFGGTALQTSVADLKAAIWKSIPDLTKDTTPAGVPDAAIFPIWDTDGPQAASTTFSVIRDKLAASFPKLQAGHTAVIGNLLRYTSTGWDSVTPLESLKQASHDAGPNGALADTDLLITQYADGTVAKTSGTQLKTYVQGFIHVPYRKKLRVDNGGEDSLVFDISDFSGNPELIRIKGLAMATGSDNFRPSLWIKTTAGYIDMSTNFPTRVITSMFGDGGGVHNAGYTNGYLNRCYLNDPVDANYACKAGRPVYYDIGLYFETSTWCGFDWSINYIGGSDGQITSRGLCHGQIDNAKITHIGIKCDTQGTGAFRNLYGGLSLEAE